jgi:hypothetical protein
MNFVRRAPALGASLAAVAAFVLAAAATPAGAQVAVTIDGNGVDLAPPPIMRVGRVFVPLRGVFERLGASVVYDAGTINATGNGSEISLQIGSTQATVNGQPETLDVAPFIVGASTYVPLRFVSEALGATVNWDGANQLVAIDTAGGGAPPYAGGGAPSYAAEGTAVEDDVADSPPPPIPVYEQPYAPAPNEIWQPGYWAFGPYGYFWVPGTWVPAPQPDYLWTPGYWAWDGGRFHWNQGYWAPEVGFYGGINYGAGYYGDGYDGGRWSNGTFNYNTYVTRVDINIVHTVYVDRTVYVDATPTRVSYNGGPSGLQARPTPQQLSAANEHHLGLTPVQRQHILTAAQDRRLLATVNHSQPPVLAVVRPLSTTNRPEGAVPVTPSDRISPAAPVRATPLYRAPAVHVTPEPVVHETPLYRPPAVRETPIYRLPAVNATPAYQPPVVHATPSYRPAPVHATPAYQPPVVRATPFYRPPAVRVTPAYQPPVVHATPFYRPAPVHVTPAYQPPVVRATPPPAPPRVMQRPVPHPAASKSPEPR